MSLDTGSAGCHLSRGANSGADTVLQRGLCDALAAPGRVAAADAGHAEDHSARSGHLHLPHLVSLPARSPAEPQHQGQIQASPALQHTACLAFRQWSVISVPLAGNAECACRAHIASQNGVILPMFTSAAGNAAGGLSVSQVHKAMEWGCVYRALTDMEGLVRTAPRSQLLICAVVRQHKGLRSS